MKLLKLGFVDTIEPIANFFIKNEGKDILTVAQEVKSRTSKPAPKKRGKR